MCAMESGRYMSRSPMPVSWSWSWDQQDNCFTPQLCAVLQVSSSKGGTGKRLLRSRPASFLHVPFPAQSLHRYSLDRFSVILQSFWFLSCCMCLVFKSFSHVWHLLGAIHETKKHFYRGHAQAGVTRTEKPHSYMA